MFSVHCAQFFLYGFILYERNADGNGRKENERILCGDGVNMGKCGGLDFGFRRRGWRALRPVVGTFAAAFGRFLLACGCCIHFLGFAGEDLDVFRGMASITSSGRYFRGGFWTFLASFLVLHPLSWLRGAGFGCFQGDGGRYVQWQAFSLWLLDVFC